MKQIRVSRRLTFVVVLLLASCILFVCMRLRVHWRPANWTEMTNAAPWDARYNFGAVAFNGKMWVLGGYSKSGFLNDVWSSSDGATWIPATSAVPWSPRYGLRVVTFNGKMWVLGGEIAGFNFTNDDWSTSDGKNWTLETHAAPV